MKTDRIFRTFTKTILVLAVLLMASCGSDDDAAPAPAGIAFVSLPATTITSYTGALVYTPGGGSGIVTTTDGTATVSQSGNTYTISFSDGVPSLTGLRFISANGAFASVSDDGKTIGISIDEDDLSIGATIGGNTWSFSGEN